MKLLQKKKISSQKLKDDKLQQNMINVVLTSDGSWRLKNVQKRSLKYLKDRICESKQYLNYILKIINQNILAILRTFSNLQKKNKKNFTLKRHFLKLLLLNFLAKFLTKLEFLSKVSNEQFYINLTILYKL